MSGSKIRTYNELRNDGESREAAMAASGVALGTAKIQDRLNKRTDSSKKPVAKKTKVAKKSVKKDKKEEEEEEEKVDDTDLDDIA